MKKLIFAVAAAACFAVHAQDEDLSDLMGDGEEAEETEEAADGDEEEAEEDEEGEEAAAQKKSKAPEKLYYVLSLCHQYEGKCEALAPTQTEWRDAEEGRFYPLGTAFRTVGAASTAKIRLGPKVEVLVEGDSSFATVSQGLDVKTRTIELKSGKINVNLPRSMPEDMILVSAPGFTVVNAAGESRYEYEKTGDGDRCFIKCLTGNMSVKGRHFDVLNLRASQGFVIRSSSDLLFTGLYGKAGDLAVKLDVGLWEAIDLDTREKTTEHRYADWLLSPKTAVRIHRAVPAVGENLAVTIMTFDTNGDRKDRYWFAENHHETTGSEHQKDKDDKSEQEAKERAAAASDTDIVDIDIDEDDGGSAGDEGGDDADAGSGSSDDGAFDDAGLDF